MTVNVRGCSLPVPRIKPGKKQNEIQCKFKYSSLKKHSVSLNLSEVINLDMFFIYHPFLSFPTQPSFTALWVARTPVSIPLF